ncbi:MAG TPA: hypothetical protein VHE30_26765 [Polyangiaceae bacterium]|nr:hypothetical protein [Polyangiaceae bacterium]
MTDMSPESQDLLDLARNGDDPSDADRKRVRSALATSLAAGAAASATARLASASTKTAVAAGAATTTGKIAAWVAVGALAGVGATSTVLFVTGGSHDARTERVAPQVAVSPASQAIVEAPAPPPVAEPGTDPVAATDEAAPPVVKPAETAPAARAAAKPAASSLAAETALISEARAALGRGDAERALALLAEHERTYGSGALREERLAARVFALCALGRRAEAAATAATLLRESPGTPQRARVLDSCAYHP